ncbi:uncharacterized protein LOC108903328 [Anoplophora glabripennis]|uniref:uncharacterized protein LOC108903328 n=1 Tax=Anoplophora glabripennis TaxID=217634 RepID=UPI000873ADDC|nr:uncharacterized protein LOC108903328 [Anoplophora glabripennis]
MCPRCYEECTDIKILSINVSFLRQVSNNFQSLDIKILDVLNSVYWGLEEENGDEFIGFTEADIGKSMKSYENFKKAIDEHVRTVENCLHRNDANNNIDKGNFLGFSFEEMGKSEESYKKFVGIKKLVRYKMYKRVSLDMGKLCGTRRSACHRKTTRRKGTDQGKESEYFKREANYSEYFSKPVKCFNERIKEEKVDFEEEHCEHKPDLVKTDSELVDYEAKYFRALKYDQFFTKAIKKEGDLIETKPPLWVPPRSPHNLIEEVLSHDPWALLVATIFLNRTSCMCARPYVFWFLSENRDPLAVLGKYPEDLEKYFDKLGLQKTRAVQVWRMSHDFVYKDWRNVKDLYGIGSYGEAAFRMFCQGDFSVAPKDRFLRIYKAWFEKIRMGQGCADLENLKAATP